MSYIVIMHHNQLTYIQSYKPHLFYKPIYFGLHKITKDNHFILVYTIFLSVNTHKTIFYFSINTHKTNNKHLFINVNTIR